MRESIYIRLPDASGVASWAYRAAVDGRFSPVFRGSVSDAVAHCDDRRVILIAPSQSVLLTSVALPVRNIKRLREAVPYALEDQLAQDVEELHFALGQRDSDGSVPVAVVSRDVMSEWLDPFAEQGVIPELMLHEGLALPRDASGAMTRWPICVNGDEVIVRHGAYGAFNCPLTELPTYLRLAECTEEREFLLFRVEPEDQQAAHTSRAEETELPPIATAEPADVAGLADGQDAADSLAQLLAPHRVEFASPISDPLGACLHDLTSPGHINLLQGVWQPRHASDQWWQRLKFPAGLAAACLLLLVMSKGVEFRELAAEVEALEAQAESEFRAAFPQITSPIYLREQAEQELRRLRGEAGVGGLFFLLSETARAISKASGNQLEGLQYRDNQLFLSIQAKDLPALETLRNGFSGRNGLESEVQSANASADGVKVRMRLAPVADNG